MFEKLRYRLFTSYRRKKIDSDLFKSLKYFRGHILDIGGGHERGSFQKEFRNSDWIIADIDEKFKPDVVCNVENLPFKDREFDCIKATELFGYVEKPEEGLRECNRVLRKGGYLILSMPYISPFDNSQHDSQRFTEYKLRKILAENDFKITKLEYQGYFFTVWAEITRNWIHHMFFPLRYFGYLFIFPLLDLLVAYESRNIPKNKFWKRFTSGFFVVAKK